MIIGSTTHVQNPLAFILSDPKKMCEEISKIEFGDERASAIIKNELGHDLEQFVRQVENEYLCLYVDILGCLPFELTMRVLCYLDYKVLVRAMQTCKKWNNMINNQLFWKYMAYRKGWGLVFLPKDRNFDWRGFYQQMVVAFHLDFTPIKAAYLKELMEYEGLQYYFIFNRLECTNDIIFF